MSRTADQIVDQWLHQLSPPGRAFPKIAGSNLAGLYRAMALTRAQTEADLDALKLEISPQTSTLLLSDYEAVLGPDPCGRDQLVTTVAERQALDFQRWTYAGGQSIDFYTQMAASVGVTITIDEPEPAICGAAVCGVDVCSQETDRFIWVVNIQPGNTGLEPEAAICGIGVSGVTVCGDILPPAIANEAAMLICPIQTMSPADTTVVFGFGPGPTGAVLDTFNLNVDAIS
ncbi:putative phage tail protein [Gluconacetobacter diazotrophicus]|uniref:DUF2313 domain-containing protein n=1 Tax=Gluconacetobacter diazotrophicus (strain ATCC 49037 / DSM 5601 / CCUG 37298 / CIP 103539 / LMG 7603 / PAl5) TaxID=272568 RepID=A9HP69_GLUDA|nr:putative phage tail protein [Gluconacetobacter diazotrophicus]CAP56551.1 conserved hypothetical protein [Gluconacetobacter diazotrophicus PA1 5]